jgi:hypothetical protein
MLYLALPFRCRTRIQANTAVCDLSLMLQRPGYPLYMAVVYDNDGTEKAQRQSSPRRVANIELCRAQDAETTLHF